MTRWPRVRFGDFAPIVRRPVDIEMKCSYPELGVRSFGKGTFHKPPLTGAEVGTKRLFRIEADDLVFSNVFAWEGAVAVATQQDEGRFGSHRFITCAVDQSRANIHFLQRYFTASPDGVEQVRRASPGGAGRNRTLGVDKLVELQVPLPPIDVQDRIVSHLNDLAAKTLLINEHMKSAEASAMALLRVLVFQPPGEEVSRRRLSDLVAMRQPDVTVTGLQRYQFAGVYSFGRGVFASANKMGTEFAYERLSTVRAGDFIYPKLMAWEGALGVVPPECDGMVVSPEFPVFSVNTALVFPEVLDIYFRTPDVWPALAGASGGTNMRRRRLQPSAFLAHEMPVPSMKTQQTLRELQRHVQALKSRHAVIRAANDALIPATLERIFQTVAA